MLGVLPTSFVTAYARNPPIPSLTKRLLVENGAAMGRDSRIKGRLDFDNVSTDQNSRGDFGHLNVGENSYLGDGVYLDLANEIDIGDDVVVSGRVAIVTHADCNRSPLSASYPRKCGPITVEDGAWIGFGATIHQGVTIGAESVVASGAVVNSDTDPRSVVGGVPAETIGSVDGAVISSVHQSK